MTARLDHLVVAADTLEAACARIDAALGATLGPGGQHLQMGTHNAVAALGPALYLEAIAPDPAQPRPPHMRWFGFDTDAITQRLVKGPALIAWVVAVPDLDAACAAARAADVDAGDPVTLTRGDLRWRFAYRVDGAIALDGAAPCLIEWPAGTPHPAARMKPLDLTLEELEVATPQADRLAALLEAIGLASRPTIAPAAETRLTARFRKADGTLATLT